MPPLQDQSVTSPYSADNLKAHDFKLHWTHEFGVEVTTDVGEAFQTGLAPVAQPLALVNPRFGSLNISSMAGPPQLPVSGQTFLLPPWSTYEESPFGGPGVALAVIYAHFRMNIEPSNGSQVPTHRVSLIMAPEGFVGQVPVMEYGAVTIIKDLVAAPPSRPEDTVLLEQYENGGSVAPTLQTSHPQWGNDIYVKLLVATDVPDEKESEFEVSISRNGIAWTDLGLLALESTGGLRRIGLGTSGNVIGGLDWIRAYDYPATFADAILEPPPPATGGKLYLP